MDVESKIPGSQGPQGSVGTQGPEGAQGSGAQGSQGPQGAQGAQGGGGSGGGGGDLPTGTPFYIGGMVYTQVYAESLVSDGTYLYTGGYTTAQAVQKISIATGEVVDTLDLTSGGTFSHGVIAGGYLYIVGSNWLNKIDLSTFEVSLSYDYGSLGGLTDRAICHDGVNLWVLNGYLVTKIDPADLTSLGQVADITPQDFILSAAGSIWCSSGSDVYRVNPTAMTYATISGAAAQTNLAYAGGRIWFTLSSRSCVRSILVADNTLESTLDASIDGTSYLSVSVFSTDGTNLFVLGKEESVGLPFIFSVDAVNRRIAAPTTSWGIPISGGWKSTAVVESTIYFVNVNRIERLGLATGAVAEGLTEVTHGSSLSGKGTVAEPLVVAQSPGFIVNANIAEDAAITGTKVVPAFGSQDITTTGTVVVGTPPAATKSSTTILRKNAPYTDLVYIESLGTGANQNNISILPTIVWSGTPFESEPTGVYITVSLGVVSEVTATFWPPTAGLFVTAIQDLDPRTLVTATLLGSSSDELPETWPPTFTGGSDGGADASAAMQIFSTTKGLLPPRMTTTQRLAIVSPAPGLEVYDLTVEALYTYNNTGGWTKQGVVPAGSMLLVGDVAAVRGAKIAVATTDGSYIYARSDQPTSGYDVEKIRISNGEHVAGIDLGGYEIFAAKVIGGNLYVQTGTAMTKINPVTMAVVGSALDLSGISTASIILRNFADDTDTVLVTSSANGYSQNNMTALVEDGTTGMKVTLTLGATIEVFDNLADASAVVAAFSGSTIAAVSLVGTGTDTLKRIPATNLTGGLSQMQYGQFTYDGTFLWVVTERSLTAIDPATMTVDHSTLDIFDASKTLVGKMIYDSVNDAIWMGWSTYAYRFTVTTEVLAATIDLSGAYAMDFVKLGSYVWYCDQETCTIGRIDPTDNSVLAAAIDLNFTSGSAASTGRVVGLAALGSNILAVASCGTGGNVQLVKVDPAYGTCPSRVVLGHSGLTGPVDILVSGSDAYVCIESTKMARVVIF